MKKIKINNILDKIQATCLFAGLIGCLFSGTSIAFFLTYVGIIVAIAGASGIVRRWVNG